jgi:outer membrane protein OmpA-like peptidoglycan-associated protein
MKYQVADDTVDGNNIIVVDQLALGEPVDSPDALDLPIKLGATLLRDSEGRIKLQVPVKGNVKDPQFDFAKTIKSALTGTIEHAGSDPFATITEVDGFTGEELSSVTFEFGSSELQDREIQKLNALAKFLKEKNTLTLGIVGMADRQMDGTSLLKSSPDESSPDDDQAAEIKVQEDPAAGQVVDEERLKQLAQRRAEQVSAYLIEKANVEAKQIQLKPYQIKPAPNGDGGFVELSLSVE